MSARPDAGVTAQEAGIVEADLHILSREPAFRSLVRLFQSRKAQERDTAPLQRLLFEDLWALIKRDAGLP